MINNVISTISISQIVVIRHVNSCYHNRIISVNRIVGGVIWITIMIATVILINNLEVVSAVVTIAAFIS